MFKVILKRVLEIVQKLVPLCVSDDGVWLVNSYTLWTWSGVRTS